jgi:hypothetical protein
MDPRSRWASIWIFDTEVASFSLRQRRVTPIKFLRNKYALALMNRNQWASAATPPRAPANAVSQTRGTPIK